MGYTPRDTYGGGSSESRESVQGNRERIDRDRDRDRNSSYSERKDQQEAEAKAKAEAEQKAKEEAERKERESREKAEREAREKAKREAEEKARKEAEAKAKEEAGSFGGFGQLSNTAMGSGILSRMSLSSPTKAQESMGITSDVQRSLPSGTRISDDDMVKAIESANNSVDRDIAYGAAGTIADAVAPGIGSNLVGVAKKAFADDSLESQAWADNLTASLAPNIFQANLDNAAKQDKLSSAVKEDMSNNGIVSNVLGTAQAGTMAGILNGSKTAANIVPALNNPFTNLMSNVADPIIGRERWNKKNAEELARLGIDVSSNNNDINSSRSDRDSGQDRATGILANMVAKGTTEQSNTTLAQQPELPSFKWASGDDFKFNYGMGFKR
ncbi:hypothetical protein ACF8PD_13545 [Vibrio plantisponsor]|uniref:hypothetical protein n=1 Tax=Vibrio plantisponsor TaxID=664643 RepID=UPI00370A70D1